ncbi:helix-turn-helix transcriptional regulator [bacterium]|nr:helix-turn-helix transcriptional regulator [bacterium]
MRNKRTELTKKFGWKVKIERMKRDMPQEKLAEISDLSINTISAIERGTTTPSIETANDIANAFGMELIELLNFNNIEL